jgi:hypothetical protein
MRALDFLIIAATLGCLSKVSSFCIENAGNEAIYVRADLIDGITMYNPGMGDRTFGGFGSGNYEGIRIEPKGSTVSDWIE